LLIDRHRGQNVAPLHCFGRMFQEFTTAAPDERCATATWRAAVMLRRSISVNLHKIDVA